MLRETLLIFYAKDYDATEGFTGKLILFDLIEEAKDYEDWTFGYNFFSDKGETADKLGNLV